MRINHASSIHPPRGKGVTRISWWSIILGTLVLCCALPSILYYTSNNSPSGLIGSSSGPSNRRDDDDINALRLQNHNGNRDKHNHDEEHFGEKTVFDFMESFSGSGHDMKVPKPFVIKNNAGSHASGSASASRTRNSQVIDVPLRVGIVIPYIGDSLPNWFDAFCLSAATSGSVYDWMIFVTEAPLRPTPPNVKLIRMSLKEVSRRVASLDSTILQDFVGGVTDSSTDRDADEVDLKEIEELLTNYSYMMVELKPCFGFMFKDYLVGYSHWAYADVDQLVGHMHSIISPETLHTYDVVTTSFGDNFRMYVRGQFTVHKNLDFLNMLWQSCDHLSHIGQRLLEYRKSGYKKWHFHSAEGCYARVVADREDISLFVSASQLSDAVGGKREEKESFLLGNTLFRCFDEPLLSIGGVRGASYVVDSEKFTLVRDHILRDTRSLDSRMKGSVALHRDDYMCAYWLPPDFQVCLSKVPATHDVAMINGKISYSATDEHVPVGKCREGSTTHFQGWKKNLYHFVGRAPPFNAHALVVTDGGFIPLRYPVLHPSSLRGKGGSQPDLQLPTFGELRGTDDVADGRMHQSDVPAFDFDHRSKSNTKRFTIPRLSAAMTTTAAEGDSLATVYCAGFSSDLKHCQCPLLGKDIHIAQIGNEKDSSHLRDNAVAAPRVTMLSVAWASEFYDSSLDTMLDAWNGPKVLILAYSAVLEEERVDEVSHRADVTLVEVNLGPCYEKMKLRKKKLRKALPDATLLNIGLDLIKTELVAVFPKGMVPTYSEDVKEDNAANANIAEQHKIAENLHKKKMPDDPGPVALLLPTYVVSPKMGSEKEPERGRRHLDDSNVLDATSYPPKGDSSEHSNTCGQHQSSKLMLDYYHRSYDIFKYGSGKSDVAMSKIFESVEFDAKEFSARKSMAIPIVFKPSDGPHGAGFVRFPEELSGAGCYGSIIYRILAGSGFHMRWSGVYAIAPNNDVAISSSDTSKKSESCSCAYESSDLQASNEFVLKLSKYYRRAVALRMTGMTHLFSTGGMGAKQEEEQLDLMKKSERAKNTEH